VHIGICAGGCNAGDGPKDKPDVELFIAMALQRRPGFAFDKASAFCHRITLMEFVVSSKSDRGRGPEGEELKKIPLNLAIVGGGRACRFFLELLKK
jgi:hypothetical protein